MKDVECRLIDLSLGGVLILVRRDSGLSILDEMSFDLYLEGSSTLENVKGLVIRIQALTPDPESQYAKYALKFIDMSSNLEARLLKYLKKTYPYEW
jgi:c-di-GMP-binding flagellar brake protein YcgR